MSKRIIFCAIFIATYPLTVLAGQGTIRETEDAIIIEYSGENDEEVKDALKVRELDEKQKAVDDEKQKKLIEQSAEKTKEKAVIRAQRASRVRESEEELKNE